LSNHINVTPIYAMSDTAPEPSERFLLDNYLGDRRNDALRPSGSGSKGAGTSSLEIDLLTFTDPDFDMTADYLDDVQAITNPYPNDAGLQRLLDLAKSETLLLQEVWLAKGGVSLHRENGGASMELSASGSTSFGQGIVVAETGSELTFSLELVAMANSNDTLVVSLDGIQLSSFRLGDLALNQTFNVSLLPVADLLGVLTFTLNGDAANPSIVRIDNMSIDPTSEVLPKIRMDRLANGSFKLFPEPAASMGQFDMSRDLRSWNQVSPMGTNVTDLIMDPDPAGKPFFRFRVSP